MLHEQAALGGTDPLVISLGADVAIEEPLSALLPRAFGPSYLG
jgi:cytidine deaminase